MLCFIIVTKMRSAVSFPKAVTLSLAEPVSAVALGLFLLKEKLPLVSQVGMILVFAGLVNASFAGLRKNRIECKSK